MGISLFKHKMFSFILSSILAGIGGGLLASVVGSINPLLFRFVLAYDILLIVVLGGLGSISGTIVGAFIITIAKEWLRWLDNGFSLGFVQVPAVAGLRMVIFSLLLMCVILFYRKGLFGSKEFSWAACGRFLKAAGGIVTKPFRSLKKGGEK
jgi:branched-chain amino acid transport system permease protein